ncbi:MAG: hypothetical protein KF884_10560 [Fimbriimonadaceae bacterium]|nr:hypothetical protein [Fimbriimonadaceae bacterium]QYK57987.1 MAG: hypothetical protein KF884_10560 [Fimbriimonadaceae bacterium]
MRRASLLLLPAALAVVGCESGLTEAKIVAMVREREAAQAAGKAWAMPNPPVETAQTPDLEARNVLVGSTEEEARRAQGLLDAGQGSDIERLSRELTRAYLAEFRSKSAGEWGQIDERNSQRTLQALFAAESAFLSHASLVGPLWGTVAFAAAFPDPDPMSLREPPVYDFIGRQDFKMAAAARTRIRSLDESFRAVYGQSIDEATQKLRAERTTWLKDQIQGEDEARQRAEREARSLVSTSTGRVREGIQPPVVAMPPTSGERVSIAGIRPSDPDWRVRPESGWNAGQRERERIQVYSDVHGYRPDPRVGTDVTSDFRSWQQKRGFGR